MTQRTRTDLWLFGALTLVASWVPQLLARQIGPISDGPARIWFVVGTSGPTLAALALWLVGRRRRGLAVAGLSTATLGWITSSLRYLVLSVVAGVGSGMVNPPLSASVADVIGPGARGGPVLAGFQMAADLGAIIGPVTAGFLADTVGYGPPLTLTGALMLVALVAWVRARSRSRPGAGDVRAEALRGAGRHGRHVSAGIMCRTGAGRRSD